MSRPLKIYIIAGEASGDVLGSKLMRALKARRSNIEFVGIGGKLMEEQGLTSLFPMRELSIVGLIEIIPKILHFKRLIKQTVLDIKEQKPDLLITIDSPGFNHRVVKELQPREIPFVQYVAPSVWAYMPDRAAKVAKLYDMLLTLLPNEKPYFTPYGLKTVWVGHPVIEDRQGDGTAFRKKYNIPLDVPVLGVFAGSRIGEMKRLLPIFAETILKVSRYFPGIYLVVQSMPHTKKLVEQYLKPLGLPLTIHTDSSDRMDTMAACTAALTKSGTITIELSRQRVPMVVAYKMNSLTVAIFRRIVRIKYACLVNILLDKPVIPEFLQHSCHPENLSKYVLNLFNNHSVWEAQRDGMQTALEKLGLGLEQMPSERAAEAVLSLIKD